jgi:hypothetical protein
LSTGLLQSLSVSKRQMNEIINVFQYLDDKLHVKGPDVTCRNSQTGLACGMVLGMTTGAAHRTCVEGRHEEEHMQVSGIEATTPVATIRPLSPVMSEVDQRLAEIIATARAIASVTEELMRAQEFGWTAGLGEQRTLDATTRLMTASQHQLAALRSMLHAARNPLAA